PPVADQQSERRPHRNLVRFAGRRQQSSDRSAQPAESDCVLSVDIQLRRERPTWLWSFTPGCESIAPRRFDLVVGQTCRFAKMIPANAPSMKSNLFSSPVCIALILSLALTAHAAQLKVDLNPPDARRDVLTPHWENWPWKEAPSGSRTFGN